MIYGWIFLEAESALATESKLLQSFMDIVPHSLLHSPIAMLIFSQRQYSNINKSVSQSMPSPLNSNELEYTNLLPTPIIPFMPNNVKITGTAHS